MSRARKKTPAVSPSLARAKRTEIALRRQLDKANDECERLRKQSTQWQTEAKRLEDIFRMLDTVRNNPRIDAMATIFAERIALELDLARRAIERK